MNSKNISRIITILVLIIVVIAIILLLKGHGDTAKLELNGLSEMIIYQNDRFTDPGYTITEASNTNGFYVNIEGFVNTNKIGIYNLKYLLYNKNGTLVSSSDRRVVVLEDKANNITMQLNGEEEEYYFVNDYIDNGAVAFQKNVDISNQIVVDSNVRASDVGRYTVKYQVNINNKLKEIVRTVNIVDYDIKENIDLNNLMINLLVNCDDYYYTLLPNELKEYSKDISYSFDDIGTYEFDVYLKSGSHKKYFVEITSIDSDGPTGTCSLQFENSKTIITMNVTDKSGIKKYSYNGLEFYNNTTTINSIAANVTVRAYDTRDNYRDINCKASYGTGFRDISMSESGNVQGKSGSVVCGTSFAKENLELDELMKAYGYKTRDAVAAAGVYLLNYKYSIPYFWGGKYEEKGFNPQWGCRHSHRTDHKCNRPLAADYSYCEWGLDCTGFTKWAFIQAGFDKNIIRTDNQSEGRWGGDNGSFLAKNHKYQFSSANLAYANQIKPGDIVWSKTESGGHVGLVIGVDADTIQIADIPSTLGVTIIRKTGGLVKGNWTFTHFVLMDEFYKAYGNS